MQWTLDQLRQFVLAADSGSFSATARQLAKAQSAVSTAISLLEADLGVELFDRSGRSAQLTDAGQVLLQDARELVRQAKALDSRARFLNSGSEAKLTLALDEALPYAAIRALIGEISSSFPELDLTLLNGTATEVTQFVDQERAQIAFHFMRSQLTDCYEQRHIGAVAQGVFVVEGHPLLKLQPVQRNDLAHYRQLVLEAVDVHEMTYSPRVWRSDSFYSIAEMVADDLGWAILPINIAAHQVYRKPLRQLDCPVLVLPRLAVNMLWCHGRQPTAMMEWIQQRFVELLDAEQVET